MNEYILVRKNIIGERIIDTTRVTNNTQIIIIIIISIGTFDKSQFTNREEIVT